MLNLEDDIDVIAEVAEGGSIVPAAVAGSPDVALVDIDLPGTDGLVVVTAGRRRSSRARWHRRGPAGQALRTAQKKSIVR